MKNLAINFREPNVDRFVEIMSLANLKDFQFKMHIANMPEGYRAFVEELYLDLFDQTFHDIEEADFAVSFPDTVNFSRCFDIPEPVSAVKDRIKNAGEIENPMVDDTSLELLKTACQRLGFTKDQLQNTIHLAYVIACLDNAEEVETHHVSEAIHYNVNTIREN